MAYHLIDLNYSSKPKDCCYFFDSNILLPVLGLPFERKEFGFYLNYFNSVYKNCLKNPACKIYTCANQLSEVFNILMNVEMKKSYTGDQKQKHPDQKKYFKDIFRPSQAYATKLELYTNEFLNYSDVFQLIDLGAQTDLSDLLKYNTKKLDFNDHIILRCAQISDSILVSDDHDFYGLDITHATFNSKSIKQAKEAIIPKDSA